jgi:YVTN family beta-propeller protein
MNVTRQRRRTEGSRAFSDLFASRRMRLVAAAGCAIALASGGIATASTVGFGTNQVGSQDAAGNLQVSDDQVINPLGDRLATPFGKIMGSTISPNGKILATTSTDRTVDVQMFNLDSYKLASAAGTSSVDAANAAAAAAGAPFSTDGKTAAFTYITTPPGQAALPATGATAADACKTGGTALDGTTGQGNPTWSPDGSLLYVPVSCGFDVYHVDANGVLSAPTSIFLPAVTAAHPIITGTANPISYTNIEYPLTAGSVFGPNGHLYAALNGQNAVDEIDPATGTVVHHWDVDVAPRQLAFVGNKLYVTDEGGKADESGQQSYGTKVAANAAGATTTGTVSVIDTANATTAPTTINVGLHPTALYVPADASAVYVANTNDDTVSVIDPSTNKVVQTISTQPWSQGSKVGYQPDAIDVVQGHLLVSLGRANAIDVFKLGANPQDPASYIGLLPTDYYPSGVFTDSSGKVVVANRRGIDARGANVTQTAGINTTPATGHGTHSTTASLTRFTLPADGDIAKATNTVFKQNGWSIDKPMTEVQKQTTCKTVTKHVKLKGKALKAAKKHHRKPFKTVHSKHCTTRNVTVASSNPVPQSIGQKSSKIKHVFLIVKENRTYDQLFGDMKQGNGDATMAQFGAKATPNQHALATQFGLYDNTYDIGTNSSEGHDWLMMGDNPEYNESSAGEYTRSYDTEEDVLGHQRSGFLWTAVQAAGNTARNYGEFEYGEGKPDNTKTDSPTWQQYYCATTSGDPSQLNTGPLKSNYGSPIPSLNAISDPASPSYDLSIPDIYREAVWEQDFNKYAAAAGGADKNVPNFNMIWYSDDHTGTQAAPEAQVADNDLAVGRMVDKISHSAIWKDSVIFVAEDDSQAGVDHVDGHRAPIQVISPYAVHGKTVSTYYSQISMVRTIEQILGATPLNQKVAAATPMYGAFTSTPNMTPYKVVANKVPLTEGLSGDAPPCGVDTLGTTGAAARKVTAAARKAVAVPASEQTVASAWDAWATQQHFSGPGAVADYANPELMNRYTWYRAHDWSTPYPGDTTILAPSEVPGAAVPNAETE